MTASLPTRQTSACPRDTTVLTTAVGDAGASRTIAGSSADLPRVRFAEPRDLNDLVALEQKCFQADRLSRRSYRAFLSGTSARVAVAEGDGALLGAAVLLFNRATSIARLYSLAVAPKARGRGIARALLRAVETAALDHGSAVMRLEVRIDNAPARSLYEREGFSAVARLPRYYADGTAALRLERSLWTATLHTDRTFRHYAQTLDFTCGPAALMMAMSALTPKLHLDRRLEIRLWREATSVFMTSGHGGCGPFGLALAAHNRGFDVAIYAPTGGPMFVDGVRSPDKKKVIALVEADFLRDLRHAPVVIKREGFTADTLIRHLHRGDVPVVLISLFRLHGEKGPHWITVTGYDGHVFRILDPMSPPDDHRAPEISVAPAEFERMSRYGRLRQAAAVVLSRQTRTAS